METNLVLNQLLVGALLGIVGQTIRAIAGLKKMLDEASLEGLTFKEKFSPALFLISLLLGAVAGMLAIITTLGPDVKIMTREAIMAVIAAGYAGVDFIEALFKKATQIKRGAQLMLAAVVCPPRRATAARSKPAAVANAIKAQLQEEGRPSNDPNKVMGTDLKYGADAIRGFLRCVRVRLYDGTPRYYFEFDEAFSKKALTLTVGELTGEVDAKTSNTEPADWTNP